MTKWVFVLDTSSYYNFRRELSRVKKELTELGCIEEKYKELQAMVDEPLKSIVGSDVPVGILLDQSDAAKVRRGLYLSRLYNVSGYFSFQ